MLAGALKLADPNPISAEHLMVAMSSYECSANTFLKEAGFETTKPQTKIDVSGATFVTDVRFDPELASFFLEIARDAGLPKHTPVNSLYFLLALLRLSQRGTLKTSLTDATSTQRLRELSEKLVLAIAPKEENIATPKIASPIQQAVTTTNAMQAINDRLNSLLERGAGGQVITRDPELMYVCDRVLQTLRIAYLESRLLRQTQVDTAHILLGVTAVVEDTEPEYALPNRDLLESFRKKLIAQQAKIAAENASENPLDTQSMSCIKPEVIRLLETADKIVRGLGHYFMDIHHIALATMNSSNCELNSILGGHNMTGGLLGNNLMRCLDALNKIQRYRAQPTVGLRPPNLASVCLPLHDSERDPNSVPKHRLSAAMRCVLIDAAKDAEMFDGGKTCLRHLMLGLFLQKKEQSQTGTILLNMGVKLRARSTNEQGQNRRDSGFLSSRAISVLRRSWSITSKMGDWSIQPEHLLLAFADEADRLAFLIFEELELDPKELRSRAKEALSERKFRS
jgi:ATP-dependent Clp protease ATP-binding subunit ClpA